MRRGKNTYHVAGLAACSLLAASAAFGQSLDRQPLTFEASTVKAAAPNEMASATAPVVSPGHFAFRNAMLRLQPSKGALQVVVVDHASPPTEN